MNNVFLIGNVGNDPEIKKGDEWTIAKFSLATTEKYKTKQGEVKEDTQWHRIDVIGGTAKVVEKYVKKGDKLCVIGKITYREHSGNYYTTIKVDKIELLGSSQNKKIEQGTDIPF
jgi:single-strand DNA-binding protein